MEEKQVVVLSNRYIAELPVKVGDVVKVDDLLDRDNHGKMKLKLARITSETTCEIVQQVATSNILSYDLCVFDIGKTDLCQSSGIRQLSQEPLSIYVWEQSNGERDEKGKVRGKRRVYFTLPIGVKLSSDSVLRIKGVYFDTWEEEKAYIEELKKQGYYFKEKANK